MLNLEISRQFPGPRFMARARMGGPRFLAQAKICISLELDFNWSKQIQSLSPNQFFF